MRAIILFFQNNRKVGKLRITGSIDQILQFLDSCEFEQELNSMQANNYQVHYVRV